MGWHRNRLSLGLWDLENAGIPRYEFAGDFLPALRNFINSFGFNGDELKLDIHVGDEDDASRGIPRHVYEAIKVDESVSVISYGIDPITLRVPKQAADMSIAETLDYLHRKEYKGLLVIIGGDADYIKLLKHIIRAKRLKVIWVYPYPPRTSLNTREELWPMGLISLEDLMFNYHAQQRS